MPLPLPCPIAYGTHDAGRRVPGATRGAERLPVSEPPVTLSNAQSRSVAGAAAPANARPRRKTVSVAAGGKPMTVSTVWAWGVAEGALPELGHAQPSHPPSPPPPPRDVLEVGGGGLGHPSSLGPPMVPASGRPKIFQLQSSWRRRRRSKILAVSLKHWKGRRGV